MSEQVEEEIDPSVQKTFDNDDVIQKLLTGEEFTEEVSGLKIRPVTLATLAFMTEAGCKLIQGEDIEQIDNVILEILLFLYIHSEDHEVLSKITCHEDNPKAKIKEKAYEMGVDIEPKAIPKILQQIVEILQTATSTKVEPLPNQDLEETGKKKEK